MLTLPMAFCLITTPFKFGLHVKVFHVQYKIHVVLSTKVGPCGGVHTQLKTMSRTLARQCSRHKTHTPDSYTEDEHIWCYWMGKGFIFNLQRDRTPTCEKTAVSEVLQKNPQVGKKTKQKQNPTC